MSQVYGFVKQSQGAIELESEPGRGTCFTLYLPRGAQQCRPSAESRGAGHAVLGGDEAILVVDDEPALRELVAEILSAKGYRTVCAGSGAEALAILQRLRADLVVTDIIMPEMDGFQLRERLRADFPQTRILFVSGYGDEAALGEDERALFRKRLLKPFRPEELLRRVRETLDEPENG